MITIRRAEATDSEQWLAVGHQLDQETTFMMLEPGERTTTVDQLRARFSEVTNLYLGAFDDGKLVGMLGAGRGAYRRNRHSAHIWIGILQSHTGQGIGRRLFEATEAWAREEGVHRLELTVMTHNAAGIALYTKMGFEVEGTLRHSLCIDGQWVDQLTMAKLLD